ncbi:hypothetical protein TNCV_4853361 [Trichonephila clavipes]|nr:hypothetical protein TNCV_4853361 [Trichonephila clavipes]
MICCGLWRFSLFESAKCPLPEGEHPTTYERINQRALQAVNVLSRPTFSSDVSHLGLCLIPFECLATAAFRRRVVKWLD